MWREMGVNNIIQACLAIPKIPAGMTAIAPMIVGVPAGETPTMPRKPAEILAWIL
jgi:hypothetical protein